MPPETATPRSQGRSGTERGRRPSAFRPHPVIPGRDEVASPESITTVWGYGFRACAQGGASRNDGDGAARRQCDLLLGPQLGDFGVARQVVAALAIDRIHHHALAVLQRGLADIGP